MSDTSSGTFAADVPLSGGDALQPLREHRGFIIVFTLSAVLFSLALTYIYSERYSAATAVFFKPSDITEVNHHDQQALGSKLPVPTQKNVTQTITQLATSGVVMRRVVEDLHLDVPKQRDVSGPWYRHYYKLLKYAAEDFADAAWKILKYGDVINDPIASAVYKLQKATKISNDDSYIYTISISADSLENAKQQVDKLIEVLTTVLGRDDRLAFEHQSTEMLRLRDAKVREIEMLAAQIQALAAGNQVASLYDEEKTVTERLSKTREELADAQADLEQTDAKLAATAEKLRIAVPLAANDGTPLATARASRLSPEDYGKLTSKKLDAEVDGRGLRARVTSFRNTYTSLVPRVAVLADMQAKSDLLGAKLASAKRDYQSLTDGITELAIRQTAGQGELHVQATPSGSIQPVSPIKIYHVGAAAGLALLIAIGLAYVLDYFEIRLFMPPEGGRSRRRRRAWVEPAGAPGMSPGVAD